jgi:hypothetical protein
MKPDGRHSAKRFPYGQVYRSRFFGDETLLTPAELKVLPSIEPTEPMPAELQQMLAPDPATWYVEAPAEPRVRISTELVGQGSNAPLWALKVSAGESVLWKGRPGLSHSIAPKEVEEHPSAVPRHQASYRPPWFGTESISPVIKSCDLKAKGLAKAHDAPPVMHTMSVFLGDLPADLMGWPWHCVGKVLGGFDTDFDHPIVAGTGVLVGRNVILTASHVAVWNREPGKWWMRFFPGWYDGPSPKLGSSFVEQFRGPGPQSHPNSNDFVVCKLYTPLGDALGFFGYHWSSDDDFYYDQRWWSIGYPEYEFGGQRPLLQAEIEVEDIDDNGNGREIEVDLNNYILNGGWSGGPLWGFFPGSDPRVIGICSGWDSDGWDPYRGVFAGGGPLVDYARAARRDWS